MRRPHFDFVGRWRIWFAASAGIVLVSAVSLIWGGLNLSIDFVGGTSFTLGGISQEVTADELEAAALDAGATEVRVQLAHDGGTVSGAIVQTEAIAPTTDVHAAVKSALTETSGAQTVETAFTGPTWGGHVSRKALQALVVFLAAIVLYISVRLEFKMAIAAMIALVHDLTLTAGVNSLFDFHVSPATVIALLTILGYSLYDTVVVFDRVQETSTKLGVAGRRTYREAVNTSMNEVLMRSVNTSFMALLPVGNLLFVGAQALGATTLQDLALALFVGMISGVYSSLFLAGPFLALWKEREPKLAEMARRERARGAEPASARGTTATVTNAELGSGGADEVAPSTPPATARRPELAPRDYVRGPGRKPRSKRR